jgi:hypothetical protein
VGSWPRVRWVAALAGAVVTVVVVGVPTVLIPNPVFAREVAPTWWAWPVLLVTSLLSGLVLATYVRIAPSPEPSLERTSRTGAAGAFLAYLAVGCPVCNKLALVALGYTGALQWFAPVQPLLALAGIVLLAYALRRRLAGELACPVPATSDPTPLG